MQAYQSAPCPYCGATWNPPGAQACVNCHNALPPAQPTYAPPGYAPQAPPGPGSPQDPQAGSPYPPAGYPQQGQPGYPQSQPSYPQSQPPYPGQPPQAYPPAYGQQQYGQQQAGAGYPGYQQGTPYPQGYAGQTPYPGYGPATPAGQPPASSNTVTLFGRQIQLPFSVPTGLSQQRLRQGILVGGAALALLVVLFGIVPAVASAQISGADQDLAKAYGHQSKVDTAMTEFLKVQPPAATPDAERAQINKELQTDQAALNLVQQDEAAMQSTDQRLAILEWAALPKRQAIISERHRVALALKGLKSADQALSAFVNQDRLALPLVDIGQDYIKITAALAKRDLAGAGAPYPDAHQKMQDVLQLVRAPGVPKEYVKFVNDFNDLLDNTESLVQAIAARDNAGIQKYGALVTTNAKAVAGFDANASDALNRKTYQPMIDTYDSSLKSAKSS